MTEELKPVPCGCGGEANVISGTNIPRSLVICKNCGIGTMTYDTEAEAITAWNRAMSGSAEKSSTVERTAKLEHTYQVGENWYCENCGQQLNAYSWETPQNLAELGNENAQVSEVTSQNDDGTWQKTERTAKVVELDRRSETMIGWEGTCSNCGSYTMHEMNYCFGCGARLEWE